MWNWRQTNGTLKDMLCRLLLWRLEEKRLVSLPPRKNRPCSFQKGRSLFPYLYLREDSVNKTI